MPRARIFRQFVHTTVLIACGVVCCLLSGIASGEILTVSGKGQTAVPLVNKRNIAEGNQRALAIAQQFAVTDAVTQALFQVYKNRQILGAETDRVVRDVVNHSAAMILDTQVKNLDVQNGVAVTEVILKIDGKAMREYLEYSLGLSLTQENEGKFRTFVLAYTVEGMDPKRTQPQVLRDEVTEDRKNIHSGTSSSNQTDAQSGTSSFSLNAAHAASDQGIQAAQSQGSVNYRGSANIKARASEQAAVRASDSDGSLRASQRASMNVSGSVNERLSAQQSAASIAAHDTRSSGSVKEQANSAQSSFHHGEATNAEFSDTSTYFHKLVIYADPTKKGAGGTNEVRAKLGEILKTSGLITNFYDINLMGREFPNEDALYHEILQTLKQDPNVKPEDYIAIALNRLTPADPTTHRLTSQVTYRVVRIRDGELLLPDKNVIGDSGDQVSDDSARTIATELALNKASDILPGEIARALRQNQQTKARSVTATASEYVVRIDNVTNLSGTTALKQALRNAGFSVSTQFRAAAASESITVKLNGKSGDAVSATLEQQLQGYDVISLDDHAAILKAK
jgi:hypothetical protein